MVLMAVAQTSQAQTIASIVCGDPATEYTFCYHDNMDSTMVYQGTGTDAIALIFNGGQMESCCDHITIYDGLNATAPVLYTGNNTGASMAGIMAISTNTDHALTMVFHSDISVNCGSMGWPQLDWTLECLDCVAPTATYTVVTDCDNFQFSVDVDITELGSDATLDITNNGGAPMVTATAAGVYTVGPFAANVPVTITLNNSDNSLCSVTSPVLVNPLCPTVVTCGGDPVDETYCYINNDNHVWHWHSSTGGPLILIFSAGAIESATFDHLRIYDGPDNTSTPVFNHTVTVQELLAGVQVTGNSGDIYMEMSSDGSVSCNSGSEDEWVWQVGCLDCIPPQATFAVNTDCDLQNFTIDVDVSVLGSDSTLEITNDAGAVTVTATDTGVWTVGPFPITTEVTLTLVNDSNSLCNLVSDMLTNPLCPTHITCGQPALEESYCYANSDFHAWHWQNTDPLGNLTLLFSSGSIDFPGAFGDNLRIFDGVDASGTLLFSNTTSMNLADLQIQSIGPDIYMELNSMNSTFGSCADGNQSLWNWLVGCHDCTPAAATYQVVTDCDAQSFNVDVHLTDLGSQSTVELINNVDATIVTASDTGIYTVGPFPILSLVTVTVQNDTNSLCNIHSPVLTNPLCPSFVVCGDPPVDNTYCYLNNDNHAWHWQSSTGSALSILFSAGTIESATFDHLRIYDGPDNNAPLLFSHTVTLQENLTGYQFTAASGDIYMEMTSDASSSCSSGGQTGWAWQVGCLDCSPPAATYTVVTDCDNFQYSVDVDITVMGSDPVIDITNNSGVAPVPASAVGTYTVGPFTAGSSTTITLVNDANSLCNIHSGVLTNPLCPTILQCGADPVTETYCYTVSDNHTWHWQCACGSPISLQFLAGQIESATFDHLRIYDGPDNTSPLLFEHTITTQEDLSGMLFISTGSDIYMEMTSDPSISCSSGSEAEWVWEVGCLDCTNPEATFSVVPDCQHATYQVAVNVGNTGSSTTVRIANTASADTLMNVPAGITLVGPIPMDSAASLTVLNATNGLCRVFSPEMNASFADCVVPLCDAQNFTYCYTNSDTSYFAYQGTGSLPIAITFQSGQLLVNDNIQIYDGAEAAPDLLLFQGNFNGDATGHSFNSTNPEHTLLMRVVSDGSFSCASGQATIPLNWTMECGFAGIHEEAARNFTIYPNPTTSELYMRLPSDTHGSTEIKILDVSGRVAYSNTFTAAGTELNTFDLHGLQSGNYSVVVTTPDWVKAQNLQIIH